MAADKQKPVKQQGQKPDTEVRISRVDFLFHFPPPALFFFASGLPTVLLAEGQFLSK